MRWVSFITAGAGLAISLSSSLLAQPQTTATLDTDPHLAAWWKFDEPSGKELRDSSSKNHPGVLEGGVTIATCAVPGKTGGALQFDGKQVLVRIPGYKGVTGPKPRTVSAWLKTTAPSGELVSWGSDEAGKRFMFGFFRSRVGLVPKGGYLYMNAPVNDDQWHHVAVVVFPAAPPNLHDHVKLYKDGDRAEIGDIGLLDLWPLETGDQLEVQIGKRFKGAIDDLRIYDRALTEDEIIALFKRETNRPLPPSK